MVSFCHWMEGHEFCNSCGARGDVRVHPTKVFERVVDAFVEGNPSRLLGAEGVLHCAEDVSGTREC